MPDSTGDYTLEEEGKRDMQDFTDDDTPEEEESFADLLESYGEDRDDELQTGDKITGEIIAIGNDKVFVDTGSKVDGAVDKADLLDEDGLLTCKLGDKLELYVVSADESKIELSLGLSGVGGLMHLQEAYAEKTPVEGTVEGPCKGGFNVTIMGKRAFCPISQMDIKYVEDPADYTGHTYFFLLTEFEDNARNIVVARRDLLKREAEKASRSFYDDVAIGTLLEGPVTRIAPYGVFVELLPNLDGMVHISELSWSRIAHPDELLKVGDTVRVKLTGMERDDTSKRLKIALSIKQTTGDPWLSAEGKFNPGEKMTGKIIRCMDFGAFVEIAPGIEGLIHISEMSYTKRIVKSQDVVNEGETVTVTIKAVDLVKRRISLSLREAEGDPWLEVPEKYPVGKSIQGTVEKRENFGFFISVAPGVTGLLPKSKISKSYDAASIEKLKEGDAISVVVEELDPWERKMTLGPGGEIDTQNWQEYSKDAPSAMGALGEKLQEALKPKTKGRP